MSIMGNVVGVPAPRADWAQTDPTKADFIRNKPDLASSREALEAVTALAEGALQKTGGAMTGQLSVLAPTAAAHAVNKGYVDGMRFAASGVIPADGWVGEEAPYTQVIQVAGLLAADMPHVGPVYDSGLDTRRAQREAWALVGDIDSGDGTLTFTCDDGKPEADIPIQIECLRSGSSDPGAAVLILEEGAQTAAQAQIGGVTYGITNATVNAAPTEATYDFTVL